jgi:putative acetyltransferase
MEPASRRKEDIQAIRHFNRYYTNRLGLVGRHRFNTKLSLTEARVIYEIGRRGEHTQSGLCAGLKVDMGYLNRVVRRLAAGGLLAATKDERDRRILRLRLTTGGRGVLAEINRASDEQAEALIGELTEEEAHRLVEQFRAAERILEKRSVLQPRIEPVQEEADLNAVRILMREYEAFLGADLSFQGFEAELAGLPGKYAPPDGALFLAWFPDACGAVEPAGCVALRRLAAEICEMKRLFVRPEHRGLGLGRLLARRVVEEGRKLGYRSMRLDTLDRLEGALALYRSMGFRSIPPYYLNPLPGALFWEKDL